MKKSRGIAMVVVASVVVASCGPATPALPQQVLVPRGGTWEFLADGSNQGAAWRAADFDSSTWATGRAELGYGDGDEVTSVESGPVDSHFVTTYFRTSFTVDTPSLYSGLVGELTCDDGAVVYLNGSEIFRVNMPAGEADFTTLAIEASEYDPVQFSIAADGLRAGVNVLAVEIHQGEPTSSDISLDLRLAGELPSEVAQPGASRAPLTDAERTEIAETIRRLAATMDVKVDHDQCVAALELFGDREPVVASGGNTFRTAEDLRPMCPDGIGTPSHFEIEDADVHVLSRDNAYIVRRGVMTFGSEAGPPKRLRYASTSIFVRSDQGWKLAHLHESYEELKED
ncbi:MAG: nuclear transport factor 2 family protein [Acidobacteria bacterium]|nr:nuclear transport factor 2 family protein [Acidobacteriota bacterium]